MWCNYQNTSVQIIHIALQNYFPADKFQNGFAQKFSHKQKNKVQRQSYTLQIYKICLFSKKYLNILYILKKAGEEIDQFDGDRDN